MMEWNKIEDLDPPNGWLIVTYKYCESPRKLRCAFCYHEDNEFMMGNIKIEVTHWMELPSLPGYFIENL